MRKPWRRTDTAAEDEELEDLARRVEEAGNQAEASARDLRDAAGQVRREAARRKVVLDVLDAEVRAYGGS